MSTDSPTHDLPPKYTPADVEPAITQRWLDRNAFHAEPPVAAQGSRGQGAKGPSEETTAPPYSIVIPPPNVTAALHLGHALNNTLQDVLTRAARMKGFNAVWLPGTDHAGIATQTVVDKRLQASGEKALKDYKLDEADGEGGRDAFIEKVQAWKDEYEARITQQLKDMGCSCDWDRQAFTMDDQRAEAVREAFFQLFKDGLIYRGKRLVNWDPVTQTALADDEVEMEDVDGQFYYMKYPIVEPTNLAPGESPGADTQWRETGDYATVATTRPETMLGDTAVAVNPEDAPRAKHLGQFVKLPIVNRIIPIIGDDYVVIPDENSDDGKARMASGFLKVTPAHDPNDYEIGQRHELPIINVMAPDASISINHGWPAEENAADNQELAPLLGLSREDARRAIVRWFKERDLLADQKPYRHAVGHSYRSHVPVEPYYSDQWYLKVTDDKLAGAALRAMDASQRTGDSAPGDSPGAGATATSQPAATPGDSPGAKSTTGLKFTPARYAKTFQSWHENIRDWCISRQLWWGHRIPVWSKQVEAKDGELTDPQNRDAIGLIQHVEGAKVFFTPMDRWDPFEWDQGALIHWAQDTEPDGMYRVYVCLRDDEFGDKLDMTEVESRSPGEYLEAAGFEQDLDVLDTWFSSALWPMSTLGWPHETPELGFWNPTSVLCTAREIITLWVSRMVMFNLYFKNQLPFKDVFIHAMIQDGHGQKMSKSLGNGVDPVDIIHSHGSDAMRYTLTAMTTQTQDVRLPVDMIDPNTGETFTPKYITGPGGYKVAAPTQEHKGTTMVSSYGLASGQASPTADQPLARNTSEKFDIGQRFATKLWNATRFALPSLAMSSPNPGPQTPDPKSDLADRWILDRTQKAITAADAALADYDFHNYANGLYQFVWNEVCDWYIEAIKPTIDQPEGARSRQVLAAVLDASLRLLHPVMPFITERLWEAMNAVLPGDRSIDNLTLTPSDLLVSAAWPVADAALQDDDAARDFETIQASVRAIREVRAQYKVPPSQTVQVSAKVPAAVINRLMNHRHIAETLANYEGRNIGPNVEKPDNAAVTLNGDIAIFIHDIVDVEEEKKRLTKRFDELTKQVKGFESKLGNEKYVNNAPAKLVQETRDMHAAAARELETVSSQLASL